MTPDAADMPPPAETPSSDPTRWRHAGRLLETHQAAPDPSRQYVARTSGATETSCLTCGEALIYRPSETMAQEVVRRAQELGARSLEDRLLDVLRQAYLHGYLDTCAEDVSEHHADEHLLDLLPLLEAAAEQTLGLEYLERLTAELGRAKTQIASGLVVLERFRKGVPWDQVPQVLAEARRELGGGDPS